MRIRSRIEISPSSLVLVLSTLLVSAGALSCQGGGEAPSGDSARATYQDLVAFFLYLGSVRTI